LGISGRLNSGFNPRPRAGGDMGCLLSVSVFIDVVSIHAPAQGATAGWAWFISELKFQSTPPRRGRRVLSPGESRCLPVSIHAPAQGATGREHRRH